MSELTKLKKEALAKMFQDIDSVDVNAIKNTGITIRAGNKLVKLEVVSETPIELEEEIREEFRIRLREKLQEIKNRLNQKVTEIVETTSRIRIEAERKEQELKSQLQRAHPMPDVFFEHAGRGLSCVKGQGHGEIIWLVSGIYWPKFYDGKRIDPKYSKMLLTQIMFMIHTKGDKVTGVSTRQLIGLDYFEHYHQHRPDCWGHWVYPKNWSNPNDIIKIARDAEAVLQNVNPHSIANRSPRGLPRKETLARHLAAEKTVKIAKPDQGEIRTGRTTAGRTEDVWEIN